MASIPPTITTHISFTSSCSRSSQILRSPFLAFTKTLGWRSASRSLKRADSAGGGGGARCWFKFGNRGVDAEGAGIYGSQSRDDFDRDDVEQYFNYMGMLAVEGSYDKMEALLDLKIHPVDILLMLAASEGDKPKIEELLRAGAKFDIRDVDGRTALDRANDEIKQFILGFSVQKAA
ncbi:protein LHCP TRANSLOCATION DEFECT [Phalaenopsis equestris]|uniref:protein LHCP TRANSLOCATION DEFECT n=1 Tax=Phalaenopsis equestris TaxID=78828 RepID=UPI0009E2A4A2|nr:protein LHCP TRANSLOCATION DEFECT [Phalaenopsis equestris]XP_020577404.1 protein LHCP TRANSLOCATION DEFECT [Phalaenopsis equestris]